MNKDLERRIEQERREKAAHAKTLEEMRNEGATDAKGDLARNVKADKQKLKADRNIREALKDK
jgi:hypothetical protein